MPGRSLTILFLILWIAVAVAWDLVAEWRWGSEATISRILADWAHAVPVVAFGLGVLCGHFFWAQK